MSIDLERLRKQLQKIASTTACTECGHALDLHWVNWLKVETLEGNRKYCAVSECACIPAWAVES